MCSLQKLRNFLPGLFSGSSPVIPELRFPHHHQIKGILPRLSWMWHLFNIKGGLSYPWRSWPVQCVQVWPRSLPLFITHKHHLIFDLSILAQAISKMRPASCQSDFCLEEITLESGGVWTVVETRLFSDLLLMVCRAGWIWGFGNHAWGSLVGRDYWILEEVLTPISYLLGICFLLITLLTVKCYFCTTENIYLH